MAEQTTRNSPAMTDLTPTEFLAAIDAGRIWHHPGNGWPTNHIHHDDGRTELVRPRWRMDAIRRRGHATHPASRGGQPVRWELTDSGRDELARHTVKEPRHG